MTEAKRRITREIKILSDLVDATLVQIERVAGLYPYLNQLDGIGRAELQRLINLCENQGRDALASMDQWIRYIKTPRVEGRIYLNPRGRYVLDTTGVEFTCGRSLEVYVDHLVDSDPGEQGWHLGRVEHSDKYGGYYFYNNSTGSHYALREGMLVAVRI